MKRLLLTALLAGVVPAVLAQAAPAEPAAAPATQVADATQEPLSDRYCLRETGSRIVARQNAKGQKRCNAMAGRAYTREDLDRTGQVNIADALRMLDPAVH